MALYKVPTAHLDELEHHWCVDAVADGDGLAVSELVLGRSEDEANRTVRGHHLAVRAAAAACVGVAIVAHFIRIDDAIAAELLATGLGAWMTIVRRGIALLAQIGIDHAVAARLELAGLRATVP